MTNNKIELDVSEEEKKLLDNYTVEKKDSKVTLSTNIQNRKKDQFQEVTEVFNNDSLSLEKNEKHFIIRALKKNHNKGTAATTAENILTRVFVWSSVTKIKIKNTKSIIIAVPKSG